MIECVRFHEHRNGHLLGFAELYIPKWQVSINGVKLFQKGSSRWAQVPGTPYTDADGESKYNPTIRFKDPKMFENFKQAAVKAIDEWIKANPGGNQQKPRGVQNVEDEWGF